MNKQTGEFRPLAPADRLKKEEVQFEVGEIFTLKGCRFRVRKVTKRDVVLRPLPTPVIKESKK